MESHPQGRLHPDSQLNIGMHVMIDKFPSIRTPLKFTIYNHIQGVTARSWAALRVVAGGEKGGGVQAVTCRHDAAPSA